MFNGIRKLFQRDSLCLPIYIYAFINVAIFSGIKSDFLNTLIFPVKIATATLVTFMCIVFLTVFALWNELAHWILKIKYGREYLGLLDGMSTMLACTKRPIIQIAIALEAKKSPAEIYRHFLKNGTLMKTAHPVLNSVVDYKLGYRFYKRIDINISQVIKPIGGYANSEEFNLLLDEIASNAMPLKDTFLWELYVGDKPINWPDEQQEMRIPVVLRCNHLLGDGLSIMSLCTAFLADQGVDAVKKRCKMFNTAVQNVKYRKALHSEPCRRIKSLFEFTQRKLILNNILNPEREHILHCNRAGSRKICTFGLDTEDGIYFQKVRAIKSRISSLKFNDVVFTALCTSLSDYVDRKKGQIPNEINFIVPYYMGTENIDNIINLQDSQTPKIYLKNNFTAAHYKFPLLDGERNRSNDILLALLLKISKQNNSVLKSHDLPLLHYLMKTIFSVLPVSVVNLFNKSNDGTLILSNMPGYDGTLTTYNGCKEIDVLCWTMNLQNTGLTFLLFTHNRRMRLTLQHDCNFIQTREEGQSIINGVFKYIQQLDDATK